MTIEPRGTVYDWQGGKAWTRVMGGTVHHFWLGGLDPYWVEYYGGATVEVHHYSHPYGRLSERSATRKVRV